MLDCRQTQATLLDSPTTRDDGVTAHLSACATCRALAQRWQQIDAAVSSCPTPSSAFRKRDDFLANLQSAQVRLPKRTQRRWLEWSIAASLFLGIAAITFVLSEPREATAHSRIVEELVEWNLTVAETDNREIRESLVRDRLPELREAVRKADLDPRDRQLAQRLMNEGQWHATNTDPLEAAERLHGLAEEMLTRADESELTSERSVSFVKMTAQLSDRGVTQAAAKAARQAAALEAREQARLARLQVAQQKQADRMAQVAARQAAAEEARQARLQKKVKKGT